MKKTKAKIELRYYEILKGEYLFTLQGEEWRRVYEFRDNILHFHNLLEIGICLEGEGVMLFEEDRLPYHPGMITVIPANYPHGTASEKGTESYWEYLFIDVQKALQDLYPDDVLFQQKLLERINRRAILREETEVQGITDVTRALLEETSQKRDVLSRECVTGLAILLIVQLARAEAEEPGPLESEIRHKTGLDQVRPALIYIQENYSLPMKVSELAAVCHMSESHFRRLFEENIGMTPVEYLNRFRIWRACDLIRRSGSSMEEVAMKVGFTTTSTFNRNFKRVTGNSPYQWKKTAGTV